MYILMITCIIYDVFFCVHLLIIVCLGGCNLSLLGVEFFPELLELLFHLAAVTAALRIAPGPKRSIAAQRCKGPVGATQQLDIVKPVSSGVYIYRGSDVSPDTPPRSLEVVSGLAFIFGGPNHRIFGGEGRLRLGT